MTPLLFGEFGVDAKYLSPSSNGGFIIEVDKELLSLLTPQDGPQFVKPGESLRLHTYVVKAQEYNTRLCQFNDVVSSISRLLTTT
jgi:hypothetical protein